MKRSTLNSILLLIILAGSGIGMTASAQLILNVSKPDLFQVSLQEAVRFSVANSGQESQVIIRTQLKGNSGMQVIVSDEMVNFKLVQGVTYISPFDLSKPVVTVTESVTQSGYLTPGRYSLCVNIELVGSKEVLANECTDFEVLQINPPHLASPADLSEVPTLNPFLYWIPPMPQVPGMNVKYSIRMVELLSGQSAVEGLNRNLPILEKSGVSNNFLVYTPDYYLLKYNTSYAWQVEAFDGTKSLGKTEIWSFTPKRDTITDSGSDKDYFMRPVKGLTGGYSVFSKEIRIQMDELAKPEDITFIEIAGLDGINVVSLTPVMVQQKGEGRYVIDISGFSMLKKNKFYQLNLRISGSSEVYQSIFKVK